MYTWTYGLVRSLDGCGLEEEECCTQHFCYVRVSDHLVLLSWRSGLIPVSLSSRPFFPFCEQPSAQSTGTITPIRMKACDMSAMQRFCCKQHFLCPSRSPLIALNILNYLYILSKFKKWRFSIQRAWNLIKDETTGSGPSGSDPGSLLWSRTW